MKGNMNNIRELIELRASESGDKTCLVFGDEEITYRHLNQRVNQVAIGLDRMGIRKSDRVALLLENIPEFIYFWWGILKLGAVMVPINLRLTSREVAYIINHSEARVVVLGEPSLHILSDLRGDCAGVEQFLGVRLGHSHGLKTIDDFHNSSTGLKPVEISMEDNAVILYTSGTTGFPKGVVHTQGNYLRTAASFVRTCDLKSTDRLITANPLFHVNAQFYSAMGTLLAGSTLILARKFSASGFWDWTRKYRANKAVMLLALTTILYNRPTRPDDADNPVDLVIAGGAPKGHYRDFERRFNVMLQTLYSLTEAPLSVMGPLHEDCVDGAVGIPMLSGYPGQDNEVKVFDASDHELPPDRTGQIVIRNQAMMKTYFKDPEGTASAIKDGWLQTGDKGRRDQHGWLYFLGRTKDVIRKKGENISAVEVETALTAHASVAETAVIGVTPSDAAGEEEIMAFVVWGSAQSRPWDHLIAHCEAGLADFKVPRFWLSVDTLPKNSLNRVVKHMLKQTGVPEEIAGTYDRLKNEVRS